MESTATDLDLQSICSSAASTAPPSRTCSPAPSAPASVALSDDDDVNETALNHFLSTFALTIGSLSVALVEARIEDDSPVLKRQQQLLREFEGAVLGAGEEAESDDKAIKVQVANHDEKVRLQVDNSASKRSDMLKMLQLKGKSIEDALRVSWCSGCTHWSSH
jgi:hypothetical protein